jgi:hypothetical protein
MGSLFLKDLMGFMGIDTDDIATLRASLPRALAQLAADDPRSQLRGIELLKEGLPSLATCYMGLEASHKQCCSEAAPALPHLVRVSLAEHKEAASEAFLVLRIMSWSESCRDAMIDAGVAEALVIMTSSPPLGVGGHAGPAGLRGRRGRAAAALRAPCQPHRGRRWAGCRWAGAQAGAYLLLLRAVPWQVLQSTLAAGRPCCEH